MYAPTALATAEESDDFYNDLQRILLMAPNQDIKILMGDLNGKVGRRHSET